MKPLPERLRTAARGYDTKKPVGCPDLETMHLGIPNKLEQPNLKIIETIERHASLINLCLDSLVITGQEPGDSVRKLRRSQALEDNEIYQKTTLRELKQAFKE